MQTQDVPSPRSSEGESLRLLLVPPSKGRLNDLLDVARELVRAGVGKLAAKRAIESLSDRRVASVEATTVPDRLRLKRKLAKFRIAMHVVCPREVDFRALRERIGITQEEFACRYCVDIATVRNWEQGRTKPDGAAANLLQIIDKDPVQAALLLAND